VTTIHDTGSDGPAAHLFAVGVGAYRHLAGGQDPLDHLRGVRLSQLSSPPLSARAVTDWFLTQLNNPEVPLGSAELLTSPAEPYRLPEGTEVDVEAAALANIKTAFDRWLARCDRHEENIALFYFCGHGLMREVVALLAEDFGASPQRPFEASVDFTMTFEGMARCKARRQLYLVDACRQVMSSTLDLRQIDATALITGTFKRDGYRDAPILYASAEDDRAYALPGHPTRMAEALVRGLSGLGSERVGGRWTVTTRRVLQAVAEIISRENTPQAPMQQPRVEGEGSDLPTPLHYPKEAPEVGITIGCRPDPATGAAELSLTAVRNPSQKHRRGPHPDPWKLNLAPGDYDVTAQFPGGEFQDTQPEQLLALPPFADHWVVVE
jgi:hypothetical protein